jgi:aspartate aminotransferase
MKKSSTLKAKEIVAERKRKYLPVYNFGLGENPLPVPKILLKNFEKNLNTKSYKNINNYPVIKEKLCKKISNEKYKVSNIILGNGLKELLFVTQMAFDGTIIYINPSWVSYKEQGILLNKKFKEFPTLVENEYKIIPKLFDNFLENIIGNKMIIFNNPCNPTGTVYNEQEIINLSKIINKHRCLVFADEIYSEITFNNDKTSISEFCPDLTIRGSSLSKSFASGGWRCGWISFPKQLDSLYQKTAAISSSVYSCISNPLIFVIESFIDNKEEIGKYLEKNRKYYNKVVTYFYNTLKNETNLIINQPKAAWYIFLDFSNYTKLLEKHNIFNSDQLSEFLCNTYGFVGVSGNAFHNDKISLRLSCVDIKTHFINLDFNKSIEKMEKGVNQLISFLKD